MYLKKSLTKSFRILRGKVIHYEHWTTIFRGFFSHENLLNDHLFKESHARLTTVPIIYDVFCDFV